MMNPKVLVLSLAAVTVLSFGAFYLSGDKSAQAQPKDRFEAMAHAINSNPASSWRAASKPTIATDVESLKSMFNLVIGPVPEEFDEAPLLSVSSDELPDNFDAREHWPLCEAIKEIRDQSACGSCWAFGAASAMSDRLCIASGQKDQRRVSTQDILECCRICGFGCNGGFLYFTWLHWKVSGAVTGGVFEDDRWCKPYAFPPCNHHSDGPYEDCGKHHYDSPKCQSKCENEKYQTEYKDDKIFASKAYSVSGKEDDLRKEIYQNGSVEGAFMVYEDFILYKGGVYQQTTGNFLGGHAIKIIGWGIQDGVKYWLCVNSWNESWGEKGTFRILRGSNHCGIEGSIVAGLPKLE